MEKDTMTLSKYSLPGVHEECRKTDSGSSVEKILKLSRKVDGHTDMLLRNKYSSKGSLEFRTI